MKGSASDILPMLVVVVLSVLMAWQAITSADTLGEEVSQSFSDLTNVADTMKTTDIFFYSYLRDASMFSVNQKTYEIASDGGGLTWNGKTIHNMNMTYYHSRVDKETHEYFFNKYSVNEFTTTACSVDEDDFNIYQPSLEKTLETPRIRQNVTSDLSNFNMRCTFDGGSTVTYQATEDEVSALYSSDGNRFYQMADGTIQFFQELDEELKDPKKEFTYEPPNNDKFASCNPISKRKAKNEAHRKAVRHFESLADQTANDLTSRSEWPDGLEIFTELKPSYHDEGLQVKEYENTKDTDKCGCEEKEVECEGNPEETCIIPKEGTCEEEELWSSTATIEDLKYAFRMHDSEYEIPVESGFETLEFEVEDFYHKLEERGDDSNTGDSKEILRISGVEENSEYKIPLGDEAEIVSVEGQGEIKWEEVSGIRSARIEGPIQEARISFECPIEGVEEINVPASTAGPRLYVNSQPLSVRELRNGGFTRGACEGTETSISVSNAGNAGSQGGSTVGTLNSGGGSTVGSQGSQGGSTASSTAEVFNIQKGQTKEVASGELTFTDVNTGLTTNTWFRTDASLDKSSSDCVPEGKTVKMRPLNELNSPQYCDISDSVTLGSEPYNLTVCEYSEQDQKAKVVLSKEITVSSAGDICSTSVVDEGTENSGSKNEVGSDIVESEYEEDIALPSCDESDREVMIVDSGDDLESALNRDDKRIFCIKPGDYRDEGRIEVETSGSEGNRRWLRYYNPDVSDDKHPYRMDDPEAKTGDVRALLPLTVFRDASYWTVDRIRFADSLKSREGSNHNIWNRLMFYRLDLSPTGGAVLKISKSDHNTIQNTVIGRSSTGYECGSSGGAVGVEILGADYLTIVDNEIFDMYCADLIQSARYIEKKQIAGTVIADNDLFLTDEFKDNWPVENAIDLKAGPAEQGTSSLSEVPREDWAVIQNNRIWNWYGGGEDLWDGPIYGDVAGSANIFHYNTVSGVIFRDNTVWNVADSGHQLIMNSQKGTDNNNHVVIGNLFHSIESKANWAAISPQGVQDSIYKKNIVVNSGRGWGRWEDYAGSNNIQKNVFINADVGRPQLEGNGNTVTENAFYSSEPFEGDNPNSIIENSESAANHDDLEIQVREITGPETVTLSNARVTDQSPHADWFDNK